MPPKPAPPQIPPEIELAQLIDSQAKAELFLRDNEVERLKLVSDLAVLKASLDARWSEVEKFREEQVVVLALYRLRFSNYDVTRQSHAACADRLKKNKEAARVCKNELAQTKARKSMVEKQLERGVVLQFRRSA